VGGQVSDLGDRSTLGVVGACSDLTRRSTSSYRVCLSLGVRATTSCRSGANPPVARRTRSDAFIASELYDFSEVIILLRRVRILLYKSST